MNIAEIDREQSLRLNRMKLVATLLLVAMAGVYVAAKAGEAGAPWIGFVRAFAEAAMVGALADWFAVTALFRHPLGIPIPHTAIIPRRKDQIGASLARFVKDNFLIHDAMAPKLETMDFAEKSALWLKQPKNARKVTDDAGAFTAWFLGTLDNTELRHFLRENLDLTLREIKITPFVGQILDLLTSGNHHQKLLDNLVKVARAQLIENKFRFREKVKTKSPWWLPKFVDKEIYGKIILEFEEILERVGSDSDHEARKRFNRGVVSFIDSLKTDPAVIARGEAIKEEILAQPAVQQYFFDIWNSLSQYLARESSEPDSRIRKRIEHGLTKFADALLQNPGMKGQINRWIGDVVLHVVDNYSEEIGDVITQTVARWDAKATSQRIELQVGRDLQFIRINGTIVGGLVGLVIHSVSTWVF